MNAPGEAALAQLWADLAGREQTAGLTMSDLLALPYALRALLHWMVRRGEFSLTEVAAHLHQDEAVTRPIMVALLDKGLVRELDRPGHYRVRLTARRGPAHTGSLWRALDDKTEP